MAKYTLVFKHFGRDDSVEEHKDVIEAPHNDAAISIAQKKYPECDDGTQALTLYLGDPSLDGDKIVWYFCSGRL